ncbi:hypothetical protein GQR58_030531 [Nymphon striatum]|nr:hypothetical protein GQR58_030531 [Nymphon striatum]
MVISRSIYARGCLIYHETADHGVSVISPLIQRRDWDEDLKTGNMDLETRNARKAGTLSKERQEQLKAKQKKFKNNLETGKWYQLIAKVAGDTLSISIDGNEVASFSSEGIAHPTKRMLRLAVGKQAVVDEVKIWRKN